MIGVSKPVSVAALDERLRRVQEQKSALVVTVADALKRVKAAEGEIRAGIEAGTDTTEAEGELTAALADFQRLADRNKILEQVANDTSAMLKKERDRARDADLEAALAAALAEIAAVDPEIVPVALTLSEKLSRRAQAEADVFAINARLQHRGGLPRGTGNIAFSEARLTSEFLRTRQPGEASFGTRAWEPFPVSIPILTPSRTVAALVADDLAAST